VGGLPWDYRIKVWDVETGRERISLGGPSFGFANLTFSPDGKWLAAAAANDKTVWLWELAYQGWK
jgi:WD40 repeat protein